MEKCLLVVFSMMMWLLLLLVCWKVLISVLMMVLLKVLCLFGLFRVMWVIGFWWVVCIFMVVFFIFGICCSVFF